MYQVTQSLLLQNEIVFLTIRAHCSFVSETFNNQKKVGMGSKLKKVGMGSKLKKVSNS